MISLRLQAFAIEKSLNTVLALPMSEERSILRHSLVPNLLDSVSYNLARQTDSVALYEVLRIVQLSQSASQGCKKQNQADSEQDCV